MGGFYNLIRIGPAIAELTSCLPKHVGTNRHMRYTPENRLGFRMRGGRPGIWGDKATAARGNPAFTKRIARRLQL